MKKIASLFIVLMAAVGFSLSTAVPAESAASPSLIRHVSGSPGGSIRVYKNTNCTTLLKVLYPGQQWTGYAYSVRATNYAPLKLNSGNYRTTCQRTYAGLNYYGTIGDWE